MVKRDLGLAKLPVTYNQEHIKNVIDKANAKNPDPDHDITESVLKRLPEIIQKPLAIITSKTRPNDSIVAILTEINPSTNKRIIFAAEIDGLSSQNGLYIDSLKMNSAYSKKNDFGNMLKEAIDDENSGKLGVYYLDKKNTIPAMANLGLQLPNIAHIPDGISHMITDINSPVKPKISNQTQTRQFKRWFGNSIMTEDGRAGGKPKVFYHGTDQYGFDIFRDNSFFTGDKEYAKRYETQRHSDYRPGTYEVYLKIEKPFDIRKPKDRKIFTEYRNGNAPTATKSGAMEWADFGFT